jgi:hypothetical protein
MSPEFLPLFVLIMAGVFVGCLAIHHLWKRTWGSAVKLGAVSVLLIGLPVLAGKYAGWKSSREWRLPESMRPRPLLPATRPDSTIRTGVETMSLVLGEVSLVVIASKQYVLSAGDETFLTVDTDSSGFGLLLSCDVASGPAPTRWAGGGGPSSIMRAASLVQNSVTAHGPGVRATRPDAHTITMEEKGGDEILHVYYPAPGRLEVTGHLDAAGVVVTLRRGISWSGKRIPPGPIDLTVQGMGRIDLEGAGTVRVVRMKE